MFAKGNQQLSRLLRVEPLGDRRLLAADTLHLPELPALRQLEPDSAAANVATIADVGGVSSRIVRERMESYGATKPPAIVHVISVFSSLREPHQGNSTDRIRPLFVFAAVSSVPELRAEGEAPPQVSPARDSPNETADVAAIVFIGGEELEDDEEDVAVEGLVAAYPALDPSAVDTVLAAANYRPNDNADHEDVVARYQLDELLPDELLGDLLSLDVDDERSTDSQRESAETSATFEASERPGRATATDKTESSTMPAFRQLGNQHELAAEEAARQAVTIEADGFAETTPAHAAQSADYVLISDGLGEWQAFELVSLPGPASVRQEDLIAEEADQPGESSL